MSLDRANHNSHIVNALCSTDTILGSHKRLPTAQVKLRFFKPMECAVLEIMRRMRLGNHLQIAVCKCTHVLQIRLWRQLINIWNPPFGHAAQSFKSGVEANSISLVETLDRLLPPIVEG